MSEVPPEAAVFESFLNPDHNQHTVRKTVSMTKIICFGSPHTNFEANSALYQDFLTSQIASEYDLGIDDADTGSNPNIHIQFSDLSSESQHKEPLSDIAEEKLSAFNNCLRSALSGPNKQQAKKFINILKEAIKHYKINEARSLCEYFYGLRVYIQFDESDFKDEETNNSATLYRPNFEHAYSTKEANVFFDTEISSNAEINLYSEKELNLDDFVENKENDPEYLAQLKNKRVTDIKTGDPNSYSSYSWIVKFN